MMPTRKDCVCVRDGAGTVTNNCKVLVSKRSRTCRVRDERVLFETRTLQLPSGVSPKEPRDHSPSVAGFRSPEVNESNGPWSIPLRGSKQNKSSSFFQYASGVLKGSLAGFIL